MPKSILQSVAYQVWDIRSARQCCKFGFGLAGNLAVDPNASTKLLNPGKSNPFKMDHGCCGKTFQIPAAGYPAGYMPLLEHRPGEDLRAMQIWASYGSTAFCWYWCYQEYVIVGPLYNSSRSPTERFKTILKLQKP